MLRDAFMAIEVYLTTCTDRSYLSKGVAFVHVALPVALLARVPKCECAKLR